MARIVGLTGGIGTGKSTVAAMLARLGAVVIDADAIVHELQAPGMPMLDELAAAFGAGILCRDGSLDREALGRRVFGDPAALQRLNRIVHPVVGREMWRRLAEARERDVPLIVLDVPLLLEGRARSAAGDWSELVIVVYAPEALQIERQQLRDGASREHAEQRVRAQLPIEEKRRLADRVIDNSGTREETERQVRALYAELTA